MIMAMEQVPKYLEQVRDLARTKLKGICAVYPSCDGGFDKICQKEAYGKESNVPARLFEILDEQREGLVALKEKFGSIVTPAQLMA